MKKVLLQTLLMFLLGSAWAQTRTISGKVTDERGESLPSVNVKVKGTAIVTAAAADGTYKLSVPGTESVLVFSFIGYKPKEIKVGGQTVINVSLEPDSKLLNEVVAIGYQTVRRRDLVTAVSSVTAKDLKDNPTLSAAEALQGKLAGVQVTVADGQPGASADIYIRGRTSITQSGSPLYIVDGIQVDGALNALSPQDIESIDVLKDAASTSIYGARGSNGVVIITTKGGTNTNGKTTVNYNNSFSIQKLPKELDVMGPFDFLEFQYERSKITGDTSYIARYYKTGNPYSRITDYQNVDNIDWQKIMFGRNALQQTHNISISGGTKQTQYNLSGTYNDQEGILLYTQYKRGLINFRFDHQASSKLKISFNVRYNNNVLDGQGTADAGGAQSNNLRQIVRYQPILVPNQTLDYYDAAEAAATSGNGLSLINPLEEMQQQYRKRSNNVLNINASVNYNITKRLVFRSVAAIDYNNTNMRTFDDTITYNARTTGGKQPLITVTNNNVRTINNSNTLDYNNPAIMGSKHSIDVLVGQETYQTYTVVNGLDLRNYPIGTSPDQAFANYSLAQTVQPPTVSEIPIQNFSLFSRVSYNYAGKYFATFNLRADASSVFGPQNKWGYFPSASLAWRVSDENFMKNQNLVSDLKLRLSYGSVGNNRISPFSYGNFFAPGKSYYLNDLFVFGASTTSLGNPDLKWESQLSRNIGIDVAFFKGRLQLTVDAYRNTTSNLLLSNVIPTNSGYSSQLQNVGATQNTGLEIQLNGTIMQTKNFRWTGNFNIAWNKNIIKSLGAQQSFTVNSGFFNSSQQPADYLVKVGEEVGTFYGLKNDGYYKISDFDATPYSNPLYPWATTKYTLKAGVPTSSISSTTVQPGTQKFVDVVPDGKITTADYTVIGHALPKGIGGFGQTFAYKNFDLNIFLNFSYGNQVANYNKLEFTSTYSNGANLLSSFNDRYRTVDPRTGVQVQGVPSAAVGVIGASPDILNALNGNAKYWIPVQSVEWDNNQSFALESGSFIRLNNVTLGYTLPRNVTNRIKVSSLRVFITGTNLGTITGYTGYDPDVSTRRGSPVTAGADYSAFPKARVFTAGLNVSF
ncbi:SusC/RagA family TonB-linked outer membrane protein [Mucilaginibacter paludis]|uniref:TonB-dependent receptor plug n=1 Tax=Mucilaginibacter paludis DSM 18603 TaxID=714943 RepID=H1YEL7_9SPHI|nr:TonB-dependent receptor [Mucilaginibacter paludis]EHQ30777.1 TonB-dependent receptor plug [Mucilaginibacter paludis DSM 18603]